MKNFLIIRVVWKYNYIDMYSMLRFKYVILLDVYISLGQEKSWVEIITLVEEEIECRREGKRIC